MSNRNVTDDELESMERSLVALQANHLALTRDQAIGLIRELIDARGQVRALRAQVGVSRGDQTPQSVT